ncbi:hypothetical protein [Streptomyces sp. NPDC048496]|uniref:hypothetical protein n=1 Tax=Streptomyces sp. NPDC048496 TaxID=3365558 RepID=UPI00371FDF7A
MHLVDVEEQRPAGVGELDPDPLWCEAGPGAGVAERSGNEVDPLPRQSCPGGGHCRRRIQDYADVPGAYGLLRQPLERVGRDVEQSGE